MSDLGENVSQGQPLALFARESIRKKKFYKIDYRSTSVCSNSEQQSHSLSRQSSQQSNSHYGLVRPHSRDGSRRDKERAPMSKEAKRMLKQRSQVAILFNCFSLSLMLIHCLSICLSLASFEVSLIREY
jgi:hypothetical protein